MWIFREGAISPSPETMRKRCLSTKFPLQEIRWSFGILRSESYRIWYNACPNALDVLLIFTLCFLLAWTKQWNVLEKLLIDYEKGNPFLSLFSIFLVAVFQTVTFPRATLTFRKYIFKKEFKFDDEFIFHNFLKYCVVL